MTYFLFTLEKGVNMRLKNKITIFICLLLILFLSGCQTRINKNSIIFIKDKKIEYSSKFKISDLILKVDEYERDDFNFNADHSLITLPDNSTVKINNSNKKIKLGTIEFDFLYKNNIYKKRIELVDTTAPEILTEEQFEVELNNSYFDLKNQITCKDNYTKKNSIKIFFNGSYDLTKVGSYEIEIIAYDEKKNKSIKKIVVNVVDRKIDSDYSQNNNNNSNDNSSNENKSNTNSSKKNNSNNSNDLNNSKQDIPSDTNNTNYIPDTRSFKIEEYGTFDACLNACQQYINTCLSKGYKGIAKALPIQENGIYVGYQAVFN